MNVIIKSFSYGTKRYHYFWYWLAKHFPSILIGCPPVLLSEYISYTGFINISIEHLTQNTFPSEIIKAEKDIY